MAANAIEITPKMRKALRKVKRTQEAHWQAIADLEGWLEFDINDCPDFSGYEVEDLIDSYGPDAEDEDGESDDDDTPTTDAEFIQAKYGVDSQMAEAMARASTFCDACGEIHPAGDCALLRLLSGTLLGDR